MKRSFAIVIAVFLLGLLATIVGVSWNLNHISRTVEEQKNGTAALYRLSLDTGRSMLSLVANVDRLFLVNTQFDFDEVLQNADNHLNHFSHNITELQDPRFEALLTQPIRNDTSSGSDASGAHHGNHSTGGQGGADQQSNTNEGGMSEASADGPNTLASVVTNTVADLDAMHKAYEDVKALAMRKMEFKAALEGLKKNLSKLLRKNLDLKDVNSKAFNFLSRGAITVLYTTSNRDVKFAGDAKFQQGYDMLIKETLTDKQRAGLNEVKAKFDETYAIARQYVASDNDSAFFRRKAEGVVANMRLLETQVELLFAESQAGLVNTAASAKTSTIMLGVAISVISVLLGIWLVSRLIRRVNYVVNRLKEISSGDGDLTQTVPVNGSDELAALATAFNTFSAKIRTLIADVHAASDTLSNEAGKMRGLSQESYESMQAQQLEIEQIATAMNEMATTVEEVARNSHGAAEAARETDSHAQQGKAVVVETGGVINRLAEGIGEAAAIIRSVESDSEQINSVLDMISSVAEQTNLLALNAAIEAARAGEHGRGFAVVADEVRDLASRTQTSARDINGIIEKLQSNTRNAVSAMEQAKEQAASGVAQTEKSGETLERITDSVTSINERNMEMASAAEEQTAVAAEISRNIDSINSVAVQTFERVAKTLESSESVNRHVGHVEETLGQVKI